MSREPTNDDSISEGPAGESASLDAQLVAYLDGELDEPATRGIEQRLASDPEFREALGRLERTWDVLDSLGRADVDEKFTASTLEMMVSAAGDEVHEKQREAPRRRRRRRLIGAGGLAAAAAAGFLFVWLSWSDPNERLVQDLPVLENLDQYGQIDDVKLLEMLHEEKLFATPEEEDEP